MKKHLALGIAAALLGVSSVATAIVSVNQITSAASSESGISASTDQLAANCWMVTGSASDAGCNTSVAGLGVPGLPDPSSLVAGTGLLAMASDAVDAATDAAADAKSMATGAVPTAQGIIGDAVPTDCRLELPVSLPLPTGMFSAGLNLFHLAQDLAMNKLGAASVTSPVPLPVSGVPTADDVINTIEDETGCLAAQSGGLPIPAVCSVSGGVPSPVNSAVPGDISGLLATVVSDLAGITGQGINVAGSGNVGVNCDVDKAVKSVPVPAAVTNTLGSTIGTATNKVPTVGSVTGAAGAVAGAAGAVAGTATGTVTDAVGTATDATDPVTGLVGTVTDTVDGILDGHLPVGVPPLPLPTSTPNCSASVSGSLGGLLGSLTGTITGGCK
ncbi:MAG: hypothetical protein M3357_16465 [Actinomycetota bacterium]|nr:hypothetical protein [Actinomycetota bacterium]